MKHIPIYKGVGKMTKWYPFMDNLVYKCPLTYLTMTTSTMYLVEYNNILAIHLLSFNYHLELCHSRGNTPPCSIILSFGLRTIAHYQWRSTRWLYIWGMEMFFIVYVTEMQSRSWDICCMTFAYVYNKYSTFIILINICMVSWLTLRCETKIFTPSYDLKTLRQGLSMNVNVCGKTLTHPS